MIKIFHLSLFSYRFILLQLRVRTKGNILYFNFNIKPCLIGLKQSFKLKKVVVGLKKFRKFER